MYRFIFIDASFYAYRYIVLYVSMHRLICIDASFNTYRCIVYMFRCIVLYVSMRRFICIDASFYMYRCIGNVTVLFVYIVMKSMNQEPHGRLLRRASSEFTILFPT